MNALRLAAALCLSAAASAQDVGTAFRTARTAAKLTTDAQRAVVGIQKEMVDRYKQKVGDAADDGGRVFSDTIEASASPNGGYAVGFEFFEVTNRRDEPGVDGHAPCAVVHHRWTEIYQRVVRTGNLAAPGDAHELIETVRRVERSYDERRSGAARCR